MNAVRMFMVITTFVVMCVISAFPVTELRKQSSLQEIKLLGKSC